MSEKNFDKMGSTLDRMIERCDNMGSTVDGMAKRCDRMLDLLEEAKSLIIKRGLAEAEEKKEMPEEDWGFDDWDTKPKKVKEEEKDMPDENWLLGPEPKEKMPGRNPVANTDDVEQGDTTMPKTEEIGDATMPEMHAGGNTPKPTLEQLFKDNFSTEEFKDLGLTDKIIAIGKKIIDSGAYNINDVHNFVKHDLKTMLETATAEEQKVKTAEEEAKRVAAEAAATQAAQQQEAKKVAEQEQKPAMTPLEQALQAEEAKLEQPAKAAPKGKKASKPAAKKPAVKKEPEPQTAIEFLSGKAGLFEGSVFERDDDKVRKDLAADLNTRFPTAKKQKPGVK